MPLSSSCERRSPRSRAGRRDPVRPDWGEAEALAALGELYLARAEVRGARDLIERALLLAPDYRFAAELRAQVAGGRSAR